MFDLPKESNGMVLKFLDASSAYNGQYFCEATRGPLKAESNRTTYTFFGSYQTVISVHPSFPTEYQSKTQFLTCEISSALQETGHISWYYNRDNQTKYRLNNAEKSPWPSDITFYVVKSERKKSVLELVYASDEYNGEYYCIVTYGDDKQKASKSAQYKYRGMCRM